MFGLSAAPAIAQNSAPTPLASASAVPAASPSSPATPDAGITRSLKAAGANGQTGNVTLYRQNATTLIVAVLDGPTDRTQSLRISRGPSCDTLDATPAYALNDSRAGSSVSTINIDVDRLLSGNYNIVAFASNKPDAAVTACTHLMK
jgi:hypothetical protein